LKAILAGFMSLPESDPLPGSAPLNEIRDFHDSGAVVRLVQKQMAEQSQLVG
jgi:hypothetical protein